MKKLRKVVTKKGKTAKAIKKLLTEQAALMMNHPKECCVCKEPFERTPETVKTWQVTVLQEKKDCSPAVSELYAACEGGPGWRLKKG